MATISVTNSTELVAALNGAASGDVIECASGHDYSIAGSWSFTSYVTVTSADQNDRAQFIRMELTNADFLKFSYVDFTYQHVAGTWQRVINYQQEGCNDLEFLFCQWIGSLAVDTDTSGGGWEVYQGEPAGKAVNFLGCSRVNIFDCLFDTWWTGLTIYISPGAKCFDFHVAGCEFRNMRADNWALGISGNTLVEYCWMHSMFEGSGTEHRDLMQMRGAGTGVISDLTVRYNIFDKATGGWSQGLFSGIDGRDANEWHTNVTITDNVFYNSDNHGITLNKFDGGLVARNSLFTVPPSASQVSGVLTPRLLMENGTKNVTVQDNFAQTVGGTSSANNTYTGNLEFETSSYSAEFEQLKTAAVDGYNQFRPKAGGTVAAAGIGATAIMDAYPFDNLAWIRNRGMIGTPSVPSVPVLLTFLTTVS